MNQAETLREWKSNGRYLKNRLTDLSDGINVTASECPRVLSFSSGKGGVGKTSVVTNTALAMSRLGQRVMVLDADLGLANIDVMLGLVPKNNIKHVFSGEKSLSEILVEGPGGMLILPASSGVPELANLNEVEKLFLLNEVEELGLFIDIMLIDTSAGISDNVLFFNIAAQQRVIVVTPEPTSITDAYALIKVLVQRHHVRDFSILVNWAKNGMEAQKVYRQLASVADRFLGLLSMNYIGFVPKDDAIPRSVCHQQAVLEKYPECKASKGFMDLAKNILGERYNNHVDGGIKFFWKNLLQV